MEEPIARFMKYVSPEPMSGCWLWTGGLGNSGYGQSSLRHKSISAHRLSYEIFVGKIPPGFHVDHLCRVRLCVNPKHLEAVSPRENVMRSNCTGANNIRKTHCIRGHEFTGNNLRVYYYHGKKQRICKTCENDWHNKNPRRRPKRSECPETTGEA